MTPADRNLVERAQNGDGAAFTELVRRHRHRIHRLAIHMLRDATEADDVTQETFLRAYRALTRFDGRSEVYTWLYRIAVNLSLNRIRARKSAGHGLDVDDARLDFPDETTSDPAAATHQKQLYGALAAGIDQLSETLRTTLILVCIDGRNHEEASQILGAPEGTIAWRVHEARRKLRGFMESQGFELEGDGT